MTSKQIFAVGVTAIAALVSTTYLPHAFADDCRYVTINTWDGCEPEIATAGVVSTDQYSAVVSASYNSRGAKYNTIDWPDLKIQYGIKGEDLEETSSAIRMQPGSATYSYLLNGLENGVEYDYRAVLVWAGGTKYGKIKSFAAVKRATSNGGVVNTNTSTGSTSTGSTTSSGSTTSTTTATSNTNTGDGWLFHIFDDKQQTSSAPSRFINVDEKNGLKLAIDDGATQVSPGDTVTVKVRYENNSTKSFTNSSVEILLPPEFTFDYSNKGLYDRIDHILTISLKDFPAGAFGTATVVGQINTVNSGGLDQVVSQARMKAGTNTLKVADVDEYVGNKKGSSGVLGASASGTGFLPGSIIGWLVLLIVLALVVIVGRRYFIKKDY